MHDLHDDLDAFVIGEDLEDLDESLAYRTVENLDHAERLLRLRRFLERKVDEISTLADQQIAQMRAWRSERTASYVRRIGDVDVVLEQWARAQHEGDERRKTFKLPAGTLSLRQTQPRIVVDAPDQVATWSQGAGLEDDLVDWVPKIAGGKLKGLVVHGPSLGPVDEAGFVPCRALWLSPQAVAAVELLAVLFIGQSVDVALLPAMFGEIVPGVTLLVPMRPSFSISALRETVTARGYDEHEPRTQEADAR